MEEKKNGSLFIKDANDDDRKISQTDAIPEINSIIEDPFWGVLIGNTHVLMRFGIYITNNSMKMHGEPMKRRIAGRKGVRKNK